MLRFVILSLVGAVAAVGSSLPVSAQDLPGAEEAPYVDSVAVFGGRYTTGDFAESFNPVAVDYEDNYVLGLAIRKSTLEWDNGFSTGWELGAALRGGEASSAEVWSGPYLKHEGVTLGDAVNVSPSITFGLSAVTGSMGTEQQRAASDGGSPSLLFYLSPEVAFSTPDNPDTEVFWRMHHRSGAWGTIGGGSANSTAIGLRQNF